MIKNLVIVESPTKARTLQRFLGDEYQIEASMGHIRDLPKSDIGIDIEHDFEPKYVIPKDKTKQVNELRRIASAAETLWLATDPDREGEAIAWHIKELLKGKSGKGQLDEQTDGIKRVVFHEITPNAVKEAFEHPRTIDFKLVDAQQGRRVLDRLVGYKLSPLLWKKVKSGLSAGRVQSVAVRLIVEREREIQGFKPVEYWTIEAYISSKSEPQKGSFKAALVELNGKKLEIKNQKQADEHVGKLEKAAYKVSKITRKEVRRYPSPPFTTSTLQQAAANRLGMSAKKTMTLAQSLYERGLITYMRTDSVNLSTQSLFAVRKEIEKRFGKQYLPSSPRIYKTKSKLAQEAHEAIRPTNITLYPEKLKTYEGLGRDHVRLYELIWKRTIACQMSEAVVDQTTVDVKASTTNYGLPSTAKTENFSQNTEDYLFRAVGSLIKFDGWLSVYGLEKGKRKEKDKVEDEEKDDQYDEEKILPELAEGEQLKLLQLLPEQHFTEPPPRYNEASLIKKLEELGIGRPSTYAPIISTIQDRYYVQRVDRRFVPTELGFAVTDFLKEYFSDIVDYAFTARMEDQLDEIAEGLRGWKETIKTFYEPFEKRLEETAETAQRVQIETEEVDKTCPQCGKKLTVRFGKFGKFLACSGFPECRYTENLTEKIEIRCPQCGGEIVVRRTKKGKTFYGCKNWPTCKFASWTKPEAEKGKETIRAEG